MSLSTLLFNARSVIEQQWLQSNQRLAANTPNVTLFFSLTDGNERAQVFTVTADQFDTAWQQGTKECQRMSKQQKVEFTQARIDWVVSSEATNWAGLKDRLSNTKRNFFRLGLALDAEFKVAFTELELSANSMLYPAVDAEESRALLNEHNFSDYAKKRYGDTFSVDFSDDTFVCLFACAAIFVQEGESAVYIAPPDLTKSWTDASHLNTGHRVVEAIQPEQVYQLFDTASEFLARQVFKDGRFLYGIYPCFDRKVGSYNTVRHASSLYSMLEGYEVTQSATLRQAITRGIEYLATELIKDYTLPDGSLAAFLIDTGEQIKLGGGGISLLALVKYTQLMQDEQYLPLMERIAVGIGYMQKPETGQFIHVLNAQDLSVRDEHRTVYYDGEAAFGLMRLYGLTKDERWLAIVEKAFEYFIDVKLYQAMDHWLSYCVNELTIYRPEEKYFHFGIQNVVNNLDFILQRETTYPTLLELMMAAENMLQRIKTLPQMQHLLALVDEDKFYRALHYRAHYLLHGYFWPELAMYFKRPDKIVGSFFIRHHRFRVRIDDVQHYLSGFVAYRRFLLRQLQSPVMSSVATTPVLISVPNPPIQNALIMEVKQNLSGMRLLKAFDPNQLFRLFVDGRYHTRYEGWVGYEAGERGSVQALLNGFSYMFDHFDLTSGLSSTYILDLHKVCMMGVQTKNLKSSPGDLRFLNAGMPFLAKTTTLEHIQEVLEMRRGDGTVIFNTKSHAKKAEELTAEEIFNAIQQTGRLNYRCWYPNLTTAESDALEKKRGLKPFYEVKHKVQMLFAERVDDIVNRFNDSMRLAQDQVQRIRAIALLVRELELLHLFPDGNCRTVACVLLNQLLLNYHFAPACLLNPNLDGEYSLDQWIQEIHDGMAVTQRLVNNPSAREYDYSIDDAKPEHKAQFAQMAQEVVKKIADFGVADTVVHRAKMLLDFFDQVSHLLQSIGSIQLVNSAIEQTPFRNAVLQPSFAKRWFNNIDKLEGVSNKSLFGNFYDVGHSDYLLYVMVGTTNLHIGLVSYLKTESGYLPQTLAEAESIEVLCTLSAKGISGLSYRKWGMGWLSIDLGGFIDLADTKVLSRMTDVEHSDIWLEKMKPFIESLVLKK